MGQEIKEENIYQGIKAPDNIAVIILELLVKLAK